MLCPNCGVENRDDANFCKNCATSLKKEDFKETQDNSKNEELKSDGDSNNKIKKNLDSKNVSNSSNVDSSSVRANNNVVSSSIQKNPKKNNNTLIICITAIICVVIIAGALIYLNPDILSQSDNTQINESVQVSNSNEAVNTEKTVNNIDSVSIGFCDFYTGSSSSDKSYCSANIGTQHYGETYQISVLYSREGSNLNDGSLVKKTVDDEGFLHVSSSNAFSYYPDKAIVTIYDMDNNVLDEETYYLDPVSGSQSYS